MEDRTKLYYILMVTLMTRLARRDRWQTKDITAINKAPKVKTALGNPRIGSSCGGGGGGRP